MCFDFISHFVLHNYQIYFGEICIQTYIYNVYIDELKILNLNEQ